MAAPSTAAATSRDGLRAPVDLEDAYAAARTSRDPARKLLAQALETCAAFVPVSLALAFALDEHGRMVDPLALWSQGSHHAARSVVSRLGRLQPVAQPSAAESGEQPAASLHARHLAHEGYGPPLFAWLRGRGRVVAGVGLLRETALPPFDARAARLLAELRPLLEDALRVCHEPPCAAMGRADPLLAAGLTRRETEVALLVAQGVSNAAIAATLRMSEATVKTHLTRIYAKVGVRSRTELAIVIGRRS
jgi:DNA-binding CsgD family transcriptional regulator